VDAMGAEAAGKSRTTGDPVYAYEWVPHKGTRASFMKELEANHNEFTGGMCGQTLWVVYCKYT